MVMVLKPASTILAAILVGFVLATDVSVQHDATYTIDSSRGPVCSGSGAAPAGTACPLKGYLATASCRPGLPSYTDAGCVAPVDAECKVVKGTTWGCAFPQFGGENPCPSLPVPADNTPCPSFWLPNGTTGYSGQPNVQGQRSYESESGDVTKAGTTNYETSAKEDNHDHDRDLDHDHDHGLDATNASSDEHTEHNSYAIKETEDSHDNNTTQKDGYGVEDTSTTHDDYPIQVASSYASEVRDNYNDYAVEKVEGCESHSDFETEESYMNDGNEESEDSHDHPEQHSYELIARDTEDSGAEQTDGSLEEYEQHEDGETETEETHDGENHSDEDHAEGKSLF